MSLKVWLPLNKDLRNQGLENVTVTNNGATFSNGSANFISDNGINTNVLVPMMEHTTRLSISFWMNPGTFDGSEHNLVGTTDWSWLLSYNNSSLIFRQWNSNGSSSSSVTDAIQWIYGTGISANMWNFITLTWDGNNCKGYINGSQVFIRTNTGTITHRTITNASGFWLKLAGGIYKTGTTGFNGSIYDFRFYDNALSKKEVKELSKGLYLHYTFSDPYVENTVNYAPYPSKTGDIGAIGWDTSKHQNAIYVDGWSNGYNSGVQVPSTGYHAHWKMIDNIPTMVFIDKNTDIGYTHRWLGISSWDFRNYYSMSQGTTYTISFEAKSTVSGKCINGGFYYRKQGATSNSFNDGRFNRFVTTEWERYSATFTVQYVVENVSNSFYFYGNESGGAASNPEATSYVRNIQIEIKDHATPYTPNSRTTTIIRDNSGFGNDGTISGNLQVLPGSARGSYCAKFGGHNNGYILVKNPFYNNVKPCTFAFWFKPSSQNDSYNTILTNKNNANRTFWLSCNTEGFGLWSYNSGLYVRGPQSLLTNDKWYHIVWQYKGDNQYQWYLNGSPVTTTTAGTVKPPAFTEEMCVGGAYCSDGATSSQKFDQYGSISDLRIYPHVISAEDVKDLYQTGCAVDKNQNLYCYEVKEEKGNILFKEEYGIATKQWLGILNRYDSQANITCSLTNDGYRIYRTPNVIYDSGDSTTRTMWGGFILRNTDNIIGLEKGHTYILQFEIKGQTTNEPFDTLYWSNNAGWTGGGLIPSPSNVKIVNPVTSNYNSNEWKTFSYKWTINDDVYKVCTASYSGFVQGQSYVSYRDFKYGFGYRNTGTLGTDLYIRNIRMYDITDAVNIKYNKNGVIDTSEIIEGETNVKLLFNGNITTNQIIEI